jgi:hypothetical protein
MMTGSISRSRNIAHTSLYATSISCYDLAWLARLPLPALLELKNSDSGTALHEGLAFRALEVEYFLELLLNSLVNRQHEDGSWGSAAYSFGDRVLNTMSSVAALVYNKQRWLLPTSTTTTVAPGSTSKDTTSDVGVNGTTFPAYYEASLRKGLGWLQANQLKLNQYNPAKDDSADLCGLELVLTALQVELANFGVGYLQVASSGEVTITEILANEKSAVAKKAATKLKLLPPALIYKPGSPISHALEFTGPLLAPLRSQLLEAVTQRGSVGNSPSATAFTLCYAWEELTPARRTQMLSYLAEAMICHTLVELPKTSPSGDGKSFSNSGTGDNARGEKNSGIVELELGWPAHYPLQQFLDVWYKHYLKHLYGASAFAHKWPTNTIKQKDQTRIGLGANEDFQVDADTTATYLSLVATELASAGEWEQIEQLVKTVLSFFNDKEGHFLTYPFELTPSIGTNAHVWQALQSVIALKDRYLTQIDNPDKLNLGVIDFDKLALVCNRVAEYIKGQASNPQGTCWLDKWHMSPMYATCQVVLSGLFSLPGDLDGFNRLVGITRWVLDNQRLTWDGGWSLENFTSITNPAIDSAAGADSSAKGCNSAALLKTASLLKTSNPDDTLHALLLLEQVRRELIEVKLNLTDFRLDEKQLISLINQLEQLHREVEGALKLGLNCLTYFVQHLPASHWAALWCDKTLYCPYGFLYQVAQEMVEVLTNRLQPSSTLSYQSSLSRLRF